MTQAILVGDTRYEFPDNMDDDTIKKKIKDDRVNAMLQPSHGETPPASTIPYDEGLPKRIARGALKAVGGAAAGILATPETFGAGTIPAAMVGYSAGKKVGDVLFGVEPPTEAPAPRQATSMLGSMAEGVRRLPESLPRTAEGLMTFPAHAAESITTPLSKGDVVGAGKAAVDIPVGIAKFMATPTGLMGLEEAKDVWAQDFAGSALGMAGVTKMVPGAARGTVSAGKAAYRAAEHRIPYTQRNVEMAAGKALTGGDIRGGGYIGAPLEAPAPAEAAIRKISESPTFRGDQAANAAQAAELLKRIKAPEGYEPTYAQKTGDISAAFTEQSMAAKSKDVGARLMENDSVAMTAALKNMAESAGTGEGPVSAVNRQAIGNSVIDSINKAKEPVKKQMDYLESQIPDYGMKATETLNTIKEVAANRKLSSQQQDMLTKVGALIDTRAMGGNTTTHELIGIKRTIDTWADSAFSGGDPGTGRMLLQIRDGIRGDFARMSEKAKSGKLTTHKGQQVNADALAAEYEANIGKMGELQKNLKPDYGTMVEELKNQGGWSFDYTPSDPMDFKSGAFHKRIQENYKRITGKEPPVAVDEAGTRGVNSLQARNQQIKRILDEASPGQDVGAAFRAYNRYASREWFGRFDKGAVSDVSARGHQETGLRTLPENIGSKFWGEQSAKDLIRAIGRDKASEAMAPHALAEISRSSVDQNGIMDVHRATKWIKGNKPVLDQYGLTERARNIVRGQLRAYIESETAKLPENKLGSPTMGPMAARKFVNNMIPTLRQLGYDAKTVQAFQDYHATVQMLSRNKNVTFSGNSTTVEKLFGDDTLSGPGGKLVKNLTNVIIPAVGFTGGYSAGGTSAGFVGAAAAQLAKGFLEAKHAESRSVFKTILVDAMFDPQLAADLVLLARSAKDTAIGNRIRNYANQVFTDIRSGAQKLRDDQRGMVGKDIAAGLSTRRNLPVDPTFREAVNNTPGAEITPDGLVINLERYQHPDQAGSTSIRTGVFYLPTGSPAAKYFKAKTRGSKAGETKMGYGGTEKISGESVFHNPSFVKGAVGGKAPQVAYDQIKGKGAYKAMRRDTLQTVLGWNKKATVSEVESILSKYGADPGLAYEIIQYSPKGNTLPYAIQENIVANAVRAAGHDAVIGYGKTRDGKPFISEIYDVREITYPESDGTTEIHPAYRNGGIQ